MKKAIYIVFIFIPILSYSQKQDSTIIKGQLSTWLLYGSENELNIWAGTRYIPEINYTTKFANTKQLDFEASANVFGTIATDFSDSVFTDAQIKPYRLWARYSGKQFELRAGLQKLNFGSATILRPLMWFDGVDARDPLKLTNGVWGLLGRYYFLNNANIWLWTLVGNSDLRGWDILETNKNAPEIGGRIQLPLKNSEIGITFHNRTVNSANLQPIAPYFKTISENKYGIDIKIDWICGIWLEAAHISRNKDLLSFSNQELITTGLDYTFGIGNGLYAVAEHLVASNNKKAFEFTNPIQFTASSISYPIGLFDNIGLIFYYDWVGEELYSFLNWQRQYNKISIHIMAFWNPENSVLPTQGTNTNLFGGKGVQLMFVYNH